MEQEQPTTCKYVDSNGQRCTHEVYKDSLCFWHDGSIPKTEEDLKEKLETLASSDKPLSGFSLQHADLSGVNLVRKNEKEGYNFSGADLYRANLQGAHLFHIDLSNASLMKADLSGANLHFANLENCNLLGANLANARIENINWGEQLLQENMAEKARQAGDRFVMLDYLEQAEEIYRNLRKTAENQGLFEISGYFFYREMVCRRYQLPLISGKRILSGIVDLFCGYGEKPLRVVLFSLALIGLCTIVYFMLGISDNGRMIHYSYTSSLYENFIALLECLYFSVVTFTTLGYGDLVPIGTTRPVAAFEAFTGNFTIALFVVVFVKKMTR